MNGVEMEVATVFAKVGGWWLGAIVVSCPSCRKLRRADEVAKKTGG
jgi:hypothetical protein